MFNSFVRRVTNGSLGRKKRVAAARRRRSKRNFERSLLMESLERRQLLAADVDISVTDNPATYNLATVGTTTTITPLAPSVALGSFVIESEWGLGRDVIVDTTGIAGGNGDIFVNAPISHTGSPQTLELRAERDIQVFTGIQAFSTGVLNITLRADSDANDDGVISIEAPIQTGGGAFIAGGGIDPSTTPAHGRAGSPIGVRVVGMIATDAGPAVINGQGAGTAGASVSDSDADGVQILASISSTAGPITIDGSVGNSTGTDNDGVFHNGSIQSDTGAITINGQGGGSTSGNDGVEIAGQILSNGIAAGASTITIDGSSDNTSGNDSQGVRITGISAGIFSTAGSISIQGASSGTTPGSNDANSGVVLTGGARIESVGIDPGAASITIDGTSTVASSSDAHGVLIDGLSSEVSTSDGDIMITGNSAGDAVTNDNSGVVVRSDGTVTSVGSGANAGNISVVGNGGGGAGIRSTAGGGLSASDGMITATGTSQFDSGIRIETSMSAGSITLDGTTNGSNLVFGLLFLTASVQSNVGAIQLTGTGSSDNGVRIDASTNVISAASVDVTSNQLMAVENSLIQASGPITLQTNDGPAEFTDGIVLNAANLTAIDNDVILTAGDQVVSNDATTITADNLTINIDNELVDPDVGTGGTADYRGSLPAAPGTIQYNGGVDFDFIMFADPTAEQAIIDSTGAADGTVTYGAFSSPRVNNFAGIEGIIVEGSPQSVTAEFADGNKTIDIRRAVGGGIDMVSNGPGLGQVFTINDPTNDLTINSGAGTNTINIETLTFSIGDFVIEEDGGLINDTVLIVGDLENTGGSIRITADTIDDMQGGGFRTVMATTDVVFSGNAGFVGSVVAGNTIDSEVDILNAFADNILFSGSSLGVANGGNLVFVGRDFVQNRLDGANLFGFAQFSRPTLVAGSVDAASIEFMSDAAISGTLSSGSTINFGGLVDGQAVDISAAGDITFSGPIGSLQAPNSLTINSTSGTILVPSAIDTIGDQTFLSPTALNVAGSTRFESSGGSVVFQSTLDSVGSSNITINSAGVASFLAPVGSLVAPQTLTINSAGPLTVDTSMDAVGNLAINVPDTTGSNDDLTITGSLTSSSGNVLLTTGDNLDVQSSASVSGTLILGSVDPIAGDPDPIGGNASVDGSLSGSVTIAGGSDPDTFSFPGSGNFSVIGREPNASPGDVLIVDGLGGQVDITPTQVITSAATIDITGIDDITINNTVDLFVSGPNNGTFTVTAIPSTTLATIAVDPGPVITYDTATTTTVFNGSSGDDTLVLDLSGGLIADSFDFRPFENVSTNPGDQIIIQGTPPTPINSLNFDYINASDGFINIDGVTSVVYRDLEPITSSVSAAEVILNYSSMDESITVTQSGSDITVNSSAGEVTTFPAPTDRLSIGTGGGIDTVTVDGLSLDLTTGFDVNDLDTPSNDTLSFVGSPTTITSGAIDLSVGTIDAQVDVTAGSSVTLGPTPAGPGQILLNGQVNAGAEVVLNRDVLLQGPTSIIGGATSEVLFNGSVDGLQTLNVSGGSVRFQGPVGGVTPLSSLDATALDSVIVLEDNVTTSGNQVYNSPVQLSSLGLPVTTLSNAGRIDFLSTIDAGTSPGGSLTVDTDDVVTLGGAIGGLSPLSDLFVSMAGDLTIANDITVDGILEIVTGDSGTDNLIIQSGATLTTGSLGLVSLNADDDVTVQAGTTIITGNLDISVDNVSIGDDPGVGSTILIDGTLTVSGTTTLTGGDDADTFDITPQTGSSFDIFGGDPTMSPGDALSIDAGGVDVTIDATTGDIMVAGAQPLNAAGIEDFDLSNVGVLTVAGDISIDTVTLAGDPNVAGGDLLSINGRAPIAIRSISNLVFDGGDSSDRLTFDGTSALPTVPVTFNGEAGGFSDGGDDLTILGSYNSQTFNYDAPGADGNNGSVELDGAVITYTGLEPITGGSSVDTVLNFNTGVANNATLRDDLTNDNDIIEVVDNGMTFENTAFENPSNSLTVNLGDQGDTLTVETLDLGYAASLIIAGGAGIADVTLNNVSLSNTPGRGLDVSGAGTLTINSSTIAGNVADRGAGLRVNGGVVIIDNTTFDNNTAIGDLDGDGGGALLSVGTSITIQNGSVLSNNAATGAQGRGGAIFNDASSTLTISDSTLNGNSAVVGGGAIEENSNVSTTVQLNNVQLTGNSTPGNGGGLHMTGSSVVNIVGGMISGNTAAGEGGGLWNDTGTMTISGGTIIESNVAQGDLDPAGIATDLQGGGGIFNNGGQLTISDVGGGVVIQNNIASGAMRGSGGGIMTIGGTVTVTGATIASNEAVRAGGGIEIVEGSVTITGGNVSANDVSDADLTGNGLLSNPGNGGGLHITGAADVTVNGGSFDANVAGQEGGGLWNSATGTLRIDGTSITSNVVESGNNGGNDQGGGGVFNNGGVLDIDNAMISGNVAVLNSGNGGGVMSVGGTVTIDLTSIQGNQAARAGGGIENNAGMVTLAQSSLLNNTANINGGGIHVSGSGTTAISGGTFDSNTALQEGGGLWNSSTGLMTIDGGAVIQANEAGGDADPAGDNANLQGGGGIFNDGGTLTITNTGGAVTIQNNLASGATRGSGGGILSIDGDVTINGADILANEAVRAGGGIEIVTGFANITQTSISGNDVSDDDLLGAGLAASPGNGGGIHVTDDAMVFIASDSSINGNTAQAEGGGLWNSATGTMTLDGMTAGDVSVVGNEARGDAAAGFAGIDLQGGGGIFNNGGTLILNGDRTTRNILIQNNAASGSTNGSGGGVLSTGGNISLNGATIDANEAVRAGGGIEVIDGIVAILETTVSGNDVSADDLLGKGLGATAGNGGGLHVTGPANVRFDGSTASANVAASEGGGLWNSATGVLRLEDNLGNTMVVDNIARGNADPAGDPSNLQGGGGIFNNGGGLRFDDADGSNTITVSGNAATGATFGSGGGILTIAGPVDGFALQVTGNEAVRAGGGIEVVTGTVTLEDTNVSDNDVSEADLLGLGLLASPGNGGGLHVTGAALVSITTGMIAGNIAQAEGGGLWNSATGTLNVNTGTTVSDNIAGGDAAPGAMLTDVQGGGGIFNNGGTLNIIGDADSPDVTISFNAATGSANGSGGGILSIGGAVNLSNAIVDSNEAVRAGGGIEVVGGSVDISNTTVSNNDASEANLLDLGLTANPGNGGGLHVTGDADITVRAQSRFVTNVAGREGGGLWNASGTMTVEGGSIIDMNVASGDAADDGGGGIFNNGGVLRINDSLIDQNTADGLSGSGGGIFNNDGTVIVDNNSAINANVANRAGGGIEAFNGLTNVSNSSLDQNVATGLGNGPGNGGGLHISSGGVATLAGVSVTNNSAAAEGGGLWNSGTGTLTVQATNPLNTTTFTFEDSSADAAGIAATVDAFRNQLGNLNANQIGSVGGGRREINWDAAPDAVSAPNAFPGDFFNDSSSPRARGVVLSTPGSGFQLSATAASGTPIDFGNITAGYENRFEPFSAERLFTPIGSNVTVVDFFVPGTDIPAVVSGFGAVFSDVDDANTTRIEYFDSSGALLASRDVLPGPTTATDEHFEFLGISFNAPVVAQVRITTGAAAPGPTGVDIVVMDDFIFGEPVAATTVSQSTITGNTASGDASDQGGGGIFNDGGLLDVQNANVSNNLADGLGGNGGGILAVNDSLVLVSGSTISQNTATIDGGGLFASGSAGSVVFDGVTTTGNVTGDSGGGAFIDGPTTSIDLSDFSNNSALGSLALDGDGGGLFLRGQVGSGNFQIGRTSFDSNTAVGGGGGAFLVDASGTFFNNSFTNNQVTGNGTTFDTGGGGLAFVGETMIPTLDASLLFVSQNTSPAAGGIGLVDAIFTADDVQVLQNNATESLSGAGGIGVLKTTGFAGLSLALSNATVNNNTTAGEGGGIGVINGDIELTDTTISSNQATGGRGGGIGLLNNGLAGTATLRSTTISDNTSADNGGGIAALNMGIDFENVTVSGNSAAAAGGGLAYDNNADTVARSIRFSTFASNLGPGGGSNVSATGNPIDVLGSIFDNGVISAPAGALNSLGFNLDSGNTSGFAESTDSTDTDPLLGPLQDNGGAVFTHLPSSASPVIDAAGDAGPDFDARGIARPFDGNADGLALFDIGAVEAVVVGLLDFGDAGAPYPTTLADDGARHGVSSLFLGAGVDDELDGQPNATATGDDLDGNDDEDGVLISGALTSGGTAEIGITASGAGFLNAFIDFNQDGVWSPTEQVVTDLALSDGTQTITIAVPASAALGQTAARFRFDSVGGLSATGAAADGEVEDYLVTIAAPQTMFVVDSTADNDDGNIGPGELTLREAIQLANSNPAAGTITFDPAISTATILLDSALGTLSITESLTIVGPGADQLTIDGQFATQVFRIDDGNGSNQIDAAISGVSIRGGQTPNGPDVADRRGGGILNAENLFLDGVHLFNNEANIAGGGVAILETGTAEIRNSTLSGNTAEQGGGLHNEGVTTILNSTISGNTATFDPDPGVGGGILNAGSLSLLHSTITNNEASPSPFVSTSPIGGGIATVSGIGTVSTTVGSSIIAGNSPDDVDRETGLDFITLGFNVIGTGNASGVFTGSGDQMGVADAGLAALDDNGGPTPTHLLLSGSVAIDAGDPAFTPTAFTPSLDFDQRGSGFSRVADGDGDTTSIIDVGALEIQSAVTTVLTIDDVTVDEDVGTATVTVATDATVVSGGFTVDYATSDGTATQPSDYAAASGTLTFLGNPNETQTFTVPIVDDNVVEALESFLISLSNPSLITVDVTDTGLVNINDNDMAILSVNDVTVNENDGIAVVTVTVDAAVQEGFQVDFATMDGTATAPSDYTATSGTLTFSGLAGQSLIVTVPIVGGSGSESTEMFSLALAGVVTLGSNPAPESSIDATDVGTVTITVTPPSADLSTTINDTPDPVTTGRNLVYTVTVSNLGIDDASDVISTTTVPTNVTVNSVTSSVGSVSFAQTAPGVVTVTGDLGTLGTSSSAIITINATAGDTAGEFLVSTNVSSSTLDPEPGNDSDDELTTIAPILTPAVTGRVFCDVNNSGDYTPNATPPEELVMATVFIDLNNNGRFDPGIDDSAITDSEGFYLLESLAGSNVNVSLVVPRSCNTIPPNPSVQRSVVPVGNLVRTITSVDFDNDSDRDLVVAADMSGSLTVLLNSPDGFNDSSTIPLADRPQSVDALETETNGIRQMTVAVAGVGTPGDGGSVFTLDGTGPPVQHPGTGGPIDVLVDDFNNDGRHDVLSASLRQSLLELRLGGSSEVIQVSTLTDQILSIDSGNLDNDELTREVVVAGYGYKPDPTQPGQPSVLEVFRVSDSGLTKIASVDTPAEVVQVGVADVIGNEPNDGFDDFVDEIVVLLHTGSILVYPMVGGAIGTPIVTPTAPGATAMALGNRVDEMGNLIDLNGDGVVDIAVANEGGRTESSTSPPDDGFIEVFTGAGDGRFAPVTTISNVSTPSDLIIDDFSGDGFAEIAVANLYGESNVTISPPTFRLPSTVTILQLEISTVDVTITANAVTREDVGLPTANPQTILDTSGDSRVTARDALLVINALSRQTAAEGEQTSPQRENTDVDGDGRTSAVDALMIINYLARESAEGEPLLVEIPVDIPGDDDDLEETLAAIDQAFTQGLN